MIELDGRAEQGPGERCKNKKSYWLKIFEFFERKISRLSEKFCKHGRIGQEDEEGKKYKTEEKF